MICNDIQLYKLQFICMKYSLNARTSIYVVTYITICADMLYTTVSIVRMHITS
jgi:hypothetical protein